MRNVGVGLATGAPRPAHDLAALSAAEWVRPDDRLARGAVCQVRHTFALPSAPRSAVAQVTALGVYDLYVNGARVGDALLRPGWTDVACRLQVQVLDVTGLLQEGTNVIGAFLGPGWYAGRISGEPSSRAPWRRPELLAWLDVRTLDGDHVEVVTDERWQWRASEIISSDLYDGEVADLRTQVPDWSSPTSLDLGRWDSMERSPGTAASLVPQTGPPVRETATLAPQSVTWAADGSAVFDLGRNETGFLRLRVRSAPGTRVQVSYGELLDIGGHVHAENLRTARCQDTFFTAGQGVEELSPRFTVRGARYAEVRGLAGPASLVSAERVVVGSDVRRVGWFTSSDPLLNDIYECVLTSQRANFLEVPTDCPQRDERLGWLADALLFAPMASYSYDICEFMSKWLGDIEDACTPEGGFSDIAPRPPGRVTFRDLDGAPAWADAGVLLPWLLHQRYGRLDLLRRMQPTMTRWLRHVHGQNPDGVWSHGRGRDYGDWVPAGPDTSHDLFATAWLAHTTDVASRVADLLGETQDRDWLRERAALSRGAFAEHFVDPETGRVRAREPVGSPVAARRFAPQVVGETQTGYVLALAFDLVEGTTSRRLGDRLAELVDLAGGRLQTGFIGSALLLDALGKGGHGDVAVDLLLRREFPSLGYMVENGATSIWERWDGLQPDGRGPASATMNSFNHYCLGSMFSWVIESLCGLRPGDEVAFACFDFAPVLTDRVDWVSFRFASPAGEIAVRWERLDGDTVVGEVTVPSGARCRVGAEVPFGAGVARLETASGTDTHLDLAGGTHRVTWRRTTEEGEP